MEEYDNELVNIWNKISLLEEESPMVETYDTILVETERKVGELFGGSNCCIWKNWKRSSSYNRDENLEVEQVSCHFFVRMES